MNENNIVWIDAERLQPSQFYINVNSLNLLRNNFDINLFDPIPVKQIGKDLVMTDGHTRACYLVEKGNNSIPTVEESSELDLDAYRINVKDCKERSI